MKYIITIMASMFLFANIAHGENNYVRENVNAYLTHHYKWETIQHTTNNRVCSEVDVPIYSNSGKSSTGEVLGGAIIGGVIGNQIGKGKGNDAATILGAILGADFANKKGGEKTIVGYKRTTVCENKPTSITEERKVYQYSTLRFTDKNGFQYDINFIRHEDITD